MDTGHLDAAEEQRLQDLHARPQRVVVDWDGTCVPSAWPARPTEWLPGARKSIRALLAAGYEVEIHSVRLHSMDVNFDKPNPSRDEDYRYVRKMLDDAGFQEVTICEEDKPPAVAYIDDRAIKFDGDWDAAVAELLPTEPLRPYGPDILRELEGDTLPSDSQARKDLPVASGVIDYFPAALAAVAYVSKVGNDKHNPGEPLHHARGKSMDHADAIARHLIDRGHVDPGTGLRHTAQLAWRALALLQEELEREEDAPLPRAAKITTEEAGA